MAGLPLYDVKRHQTVQNAASRLFGGVSRRSSVLPVLRDELHWLSIKQSIYFKVGVISFKAMNGLVPSYLAKMFVLYRLIKRCVETDRLIEGTLLSRKSRTLATGVQALQ